MYGFDPPIQLPSGNCFNRLSQAAITSVFLVQLAVLASDNLYNLPSILASFKYYFEIVLYGQ